MAKTITKFACELCGEIYSSEKEANACAEKGWSPRFEVGDIVFIGVGYGWFDGEREWVSNPDVVICGHKDHGNCFSECCTYKFYYVITAIDGDERDGHRPRYHVFTKAIKHTKVFKSGYTFDINHYTPAKVSNPPKRIIESSKDLIGKKARCLI